VSGHLWRSAQRRLSRLGWHAIGSGTVITKRCGTPTAVSAAATHVMLPTPPNHLGFRTAGGRRASEQRIHLMNRVHSIRQAEATKKLDRAVPYFRHGNLLASVPVCSNGIAQREISRSRDTGWQHVAASRMPQSHMAAGTLCLSNSIGSSQIWDNLLQLRLSQQVQWTTSTAMATPWQGGG
jgi:hypothetical protein